MDASNKKSNIDDRFERNFKQMHRILLIFKLYTINSPNRSSIRNYLYKPNPPEISNQS